jgi:anti-sigma factor RsiW
MACWSVLNILDLRAAGKLSASRLAQVEKHLAACERCAASVAAAAPISTAKKVAVPAGLAEAIKRGLKEAKSPAVEWKPRFSPAHAAAFACLALLALAPSFYGQPSQAGRAELGEELLP